MRVVLGNILGESRTQTEIEQVERTDEDRQQYPGTKLTDGESRQEVRGQQEGDNKAPEAANEVEERVRDELLGKLTEEGDRMGIGGPF